MAVLTELGSPALAAKTSPIRLLFGALAGALIVFLWGGFSHAMMPWHKANILTLQNDAPVTQAIQQNAPKDGVYLVPNFPANATEEQRQDVMKRQAEGPRALVVYRNEGLSVPTILLGEFVTQLLGAFILVGMLSRARELGFWGRVAFVVSGALAGSLMVHLQNWNWYAFSAGHTAGMLADVLIGWALAGLAIAKLAAPRA